MYYIEESMVEFNKRDPALGWIYTGHSQVEVGLHISHPRPDRWTRGPAKGARQPWICARQVPPCPRQVPRQVPR